MNELLSICSSLEGYSSDRLGFVVTEAKKDNDCWNLSVQPYVKVTEEKPSAIDDSAVITMAERLYNRYSSNNIKFKTVFVSEENGYWFVKIKRIVEVTNEEENSEEE